MLRKTYIFTMQNWSFMLFHVLAPALAPCPCPCPLPLPLLALAPCSSIKKCCLGFYAGVIYIYIYLFTQCYITLSIYSVICIIRSHIQHVTLVRVLQTYKGSQNSSNRRSVSSVWLVWLLLYCIPWLTSLAGIGIKWLAHRPGKACRWQDLFSGSGAWALVGVISALS